MTTIFYERFPVGHISFEGEWRFDYDPTWEARRSAFPLSLTMPLRSGTVEAARLLPWLGQACTSLRSDMCGGLQGRGSAPATIDRRQDAGCRASCPALEGARRNGRAERGGDGPARGGTGGNGSE